MLASKYQTLGNIATGSDGSSFMGGKIHLSVLHGVDKNDQHIFGFGKHQSYIRMFCGKRKLGRAIVVQNALMEYSERKWYFVGTQFVTHTSNQILIFYNPGYDCTIPPYTIFPADKPFVDIVVFSCGREAADKPLGSARLPLLNFTDESTYQCVLNIESTDASGSSCVVGTITVGASFKPNEPSRLLTVGEVMDLSPSLTDIALKLRWACKAGETGSDFGASLVLINSKGKFVDVVHEKRPRNSKGFKCSLRHSSTSGDNTEGVSMLRYTINMRLSETAKKGKDVRACFLMITSSTQMHTLSEISKVQLSVAAKTTGMELCRYQVREDSAVYSGRSAALARFSWVEVNGKQVNRQTDRQNYSN
jgi:hypothetical protein